MCVTTRSTDQSVREAPPLGMTVRGTRRKDTAASRRKGLLSAGLGGGISLFLANREVVIPVLPERTRRRGEGEGVRGPRRLYPRRRRLSQAGHRLRLPPAGGWTQ